MNLSYSNKLNLQKQNNITVHLLGCDGEDHCLAGELRQGGGDVGGEGPSWLQSENGSNLTCFNDEDMDGLEVLYDFKVPNINMVHVNTLQVDITTEEVK